MDCFYSLRSIYMNVAIAVLFISVPPGKGWADDERAGGVEAGSIIDATAQGGESEVLKDLKAVVVVARPEDVKLTGRPGWQGVVGEGLELPAKVDAVLATYLGKALSLADLDRMMKETVVAYRKSDLPVVNVLVPEQEIDGGVLQLLVVEGRLGEVKVEGAKHSDPEFLKNQIRLQSGEVLRESELMADLLWMNKYPFRRVDMVYSPGEEYGQTDLILQTEDIRAFSVYVGVENTGNSFLGEERVVAGFNWGLPRGLGMESTLNYQYSTDFDFDQIQAHSLVYTSYLPWRHYVTLLGAYVNQDVTTTAAGEPVDIGGEDQQGSVRYTVPLRGWGGWVHDLELGFDFKSSNSSLAFGGLEVFDTTTQIFQFGVGYNVIQSDRWGTTKIDNEVIWSPGGFSGDNETEVFRSQRGGAKANYVYGRSAIERLTMLPRKFELMTRVEGQWSSANLLSSETLGGGGFDTVRGWEQRIVRGDQGVVANVELRTPYVSPATWLKLSGVNDGLQVLAFFDYGWLTAVDRAEGGPGAFSLGGTGVGLRYQLSQYFSARLDYGFQVIESGFEDGESGRVHFGVRANF